MAGCVGEGLPFVGEDAAVGERFMGEDAGVVDEVFGVDVVGGIDDEVVGGDYVEGVGGGEGVLVGGDVGVGVEGYEFLERALDFGLAEVGCGVEYLALEIGEVDGVVVHDADMSYSSGGEVVCHWGAEASGTDDEDMGRAELMLPLFAEMWEEDVASETFLIVVGQG